jgi:hypothetical protein
MELKLELFWFKMCHETWLLKGDNNIEFFHRIANGRRSKKTIFSLQSGENVISGTEQLLQHITSYYKIFLGLEKEMFLIWTLTFGQWMKG